FVFFVQAEDGIRDPLVTGVQTCALPIFAGRMRGAILLCMHKMCLALAVCAAAVVPLAAQNTDIESLSGLQFNFGNPGARSLGMRSEERRVGKDSGAGRWMDEDMRQKT